MPFLLRLSALIHKFAARVKPVLDEALSGFFYTVREKMANLRVKILAIMDKLLEKVPQERRRLVLIGVAGVFAVVMLCFTLAALPKQGEDKVDRQISTPRNAPQRQEIIPHDELFLPDEPDFVPGVLMEREQRTIWTDEDAAPLWQDPLKNGEEAWRNLIEKTVDEILEGIP